MNRRRRRGQALAEFALVAPLFFVVLFGIIEFGRYLYYVQILNNGAREGARYAIVHGAEAVSSTGPPDDPSGAAVKARVRAFLFGVVDGGDLTITPTWPDGTNARGNTVTVVVDYQYDTLVPLVPIPTLTIHGTSTLVINT